MLFGYNLKPAPLDSYEEIPSGFYRNSLDLTRQAQPFRIVLQLGFHASEKPAYSYKPLYLIVRTIMKTTDFDRKIKKMIAHFSTL